MEGSRRDHAAREFGHRKGDLGAGGTKNHTEGIQRWGLGKEDHA